MPFKPQNTGGSSKKKSIGRVKPTKGSGFNTVSRKVNYISSAPTKGVGYMQKSSPIKSSGTGRVANQFSQRVANVQNSANQFSQRVANLQKKSARQYLRNLGRMK
jgi:hypothetical protein